MTPAGDEYPFWGYEDLALFLGAVLPSVGLAVLVVRIARLTSKAATTLVYQSLIYVLLLAVLYLLIAQRYDRPFWRSLRWTSGFRGAWLCVIGGPALVIVSLALELALHEPFVPSPIEDLITGRVSLVIAMIFVTILGPVWEELLFRGFLFPLFAKSMGPWLGMAMAAALFALLHGPQLGWTWQPVLIIGLAGLVFGYTRYKTGSTAASAMVHISYNVTLAVFYLIQKGV